MMNLILVLSCQFSILGRETYLYDFVKKNFNVGLCSDNKRLVSFKFGMMMETTKLYILISVWMTSTFIQGHSCIRNQILQCPLSRKYKC